MLESCASAQRRMGSLLWHISQNCTIQKFGFSAADPVINYDPGYRGRLLFSVLNAGPRPLHLQQGDALFLIWYADPDGPTQNKKKSEGFSGIDPTLINGISGEILSLQSLSEKQRVLESEMGAQKIRSNIAIALLIALLAVPVGALLWSRTTDLLGIGAS